MIPVKQWRPLTFKKTIPVFTPKKVKILYYQVERGKPNYHFRNKTLTLKELFTLKSKLESELKEKVYFTYKHIK